MNLTEKLIRLRTEKGLTQLEVAEAVHVSRQAVSRWEVGASVPTTENLTYLSRLYGVSVDYLLGGPAEEPAGQQPPPPPDLRRWMIAALIALSLTVLILALCLAGLLLSMREDVRYFNDISRAGISVPSQTASPEPRT